MHLALNEIFAIGGPRLIQPKMAPVGAANAVAEPGMAIEIAVSSNLFGGKVEENNDSPDLMSANID